MEDVAASVSILEQCEVTPAPDAVPVFSLHLPFYDLLWLPFHPLGRVIFYHFPHSTDHFIQKTIPNLKTSLALALKHFTPLAGKLFTPSDTKSDAECLIRYSDGDSVSVTFAEGSGDVNNLSGNHVRDADILKSLVPPLSSTTSADTSASALFAIQVTVFPNRAICIGITNSHVVADGSSVFSFIRGWASIARRLDNSDGGLELDISDLVATGDYQIPSYDRSSIQDPHNLGAMLAKTAALLMEQIQLQKDRMVEDPSNPRVRATFILTESDLQALKKTVLANRPGLTYVSSFTVACAYLWTCFAKARATASKEDHNLDEPQNFGFVMDCRTRLDPPLPASYFGNCLVPCVGVKTGRVMVGDEGLAAAAEALGNAIAVKLKEGPLHGTDKWMDEFAGIMRGEWNTGIAGSPKLDYYNNVDFGWGKPMKFEFVDEPLSLSKCKDSKMDIEVGVVMPKNEMDVFSTVFDRGLHNLAG